MTEREESDPIVKAVTEHLRTKESAEIDPLDPKICALTWASIEPLNEMIHS